MSLVSPLKESVNLEFSKIVIDQSCHNSTLPNVCSECLLGEAVLIATYPINRLPTRVLQCISLLEYILSFLHSSLIVESPMCLGVLLLSILTIPLWQIQVLSPSKLWGLFVYGYHLLRNTILLCQSLTSRESILEAESVLGMSKTSIMKAREDHNEVEEEDHNEAKEEDRFFGIKYQRDHVQISHFVCTDHLSLQDWSFVVVIDAIKIPILV
ncbi:hypothetical protein CR513_00751, partial [Mucuna pruriens]